MGKVDKLCEKHIDFACDFGHEQESGGNKGKK